jgi:hypothetical protein
MKAIVMDIDGKYAVVLDKKGSFQKIKNDGKLQVGYEIEMMDISRISAGFVTRIASIAAAVVLMVGVGYGAYSYSQPYSYVDVDINPSIELTVNRFDRILKAEAINRDGARILSQGSFAHKSFKEGVDQILTNAEAAGYFEDVSKNAVMFTVSSKEDRKAEQLTNKIREIVSGEATLEEQQTDVLVEKVTVQKHDDARKQGISPGKLSLLERLAEVQPEIKVEDYRDRPVKEIMKNIIEGKKAEIAERKEEKAEKEKQPQLDKDSAGGKKEDGGKDAGPAEDKNSVAPDKSDAKANGKGTGSKKTFSGQKAKSVDEFLQSIITAEEDATVDKDRVKAKEPREKEKGKNGEGKGKESEEADGTSSEKTQNQGQGSDKENDSKEENGKNKK